MDLRNFMEERALKQPKQVVTLQLLWNEHIYTRQMLAEMQKRINILENELRNTRRK